MASPVGHSLCGYLIFTSTQEKGKKINWTELLIFVVIANLADIDYLFGFVVGRPNVYHHQFTHSITMAVIVAAIAALIFQYKNPKNFLRLFIIFFLLYSSHIFIDFFTKDTSFQYGEQLLWPFSNNYYLSSISIFRDVHKAQTSVEFFPALFSYYNFITVLTETVIISPFIFIVRLIKRKPAQNKLLMEQ